MIVAFFIMSFFFYICVYSFLDSKFLLLMQPANSNALSIKAWFNERPLLSFCVRAIRKTIIFILIFSTQFAFAVFQTVFIVFYHGHDSEIMIWYGSICIYLYTFFFLSVSWWWRHLHAVWVVFLKTISHDLLELLEKLQTSRLDDQRCVLPAYFTQVLSFGQFFYSLY